jgi:hypothetical protein
MNPHAMNVLLYRMKPRKHIARVEKYKLHTRGRLVWTIYIGKTEVVFSVNRIWQKDDNWYQIWGKYQDM